MEHQKIINLLDNQTTEPSKFRAKNWVNINDDSRGNYDINNQIRFKTSLLKSSLCNYSDAYILIKKNMTVPNTAAAEADANNADEKVIFKNCAPFTYFISEIKNPQIDNTKDTDVVMSMYNVIEYSDNYSKTSGSLWQYCKDIPAVNNGAIIDFNEANVTDSFNFKEKIIGQTGDDGTKDVEKYLNNLWRTLEMPLINCEIYFILTWSANCVIVSANVANQVATFSITDTKLYVPVVTLSTQNNAKSLEQLKSGSEGTIKWNKYQSKATIQAQNQYLDYLIDPRFQGINRLFDLSFENNALLTVEIKFFD